MPYGSSCDRIHLQADHRLVQWHSYLKAQCCTTFQSDGPSSCPTGDGTRTFYKNPSGRKVDLSLNTRRDIGLQGAKRVRHFCRCFETAIKTFSHTEKCKRPLWKPDTVRDKKTVARGLEIGREFCQVVRCYLDPKIFLQDADIWLHGLPTDAKLSLGNQSDAIQLLVCLDRLETVLIAVHRGKFQWPFSQLQHGSNSQAACCSLHEIIKNCLKLYIYLNLVISADYLLDLEKWCRTVRNTMEPYDCHSHLDYLCARFPSVYMSAYNNRIVKPVGDHRFRSDVCASSNQEFMKETKALLKDLFRILYQYDYLWSEYVAVSLKAEKATKKVEKIN